MIMKSLNFQSAGAKKGAAQRRADAAIEKAQASDMGMAAKRTPAKKGRGQSRGGQVNKKLRASIELSGASLQEMDDGKGFTTNAARELQQKKEKQPEKEKEK